ncbi:hypothetical protein BCR42DRAFT_401679 [Absidia repens]|uniref:Uncharacterized protein n=1 Tax=Absidia repens TaxID=90262 RepID=A0A1X2J2U1_9FUNG|nr:hypothetical protein BCR42DRAFT_401679 [Absidia repens]
MSIDSLNLVERSVVLWHLQVCMATFYTQNYPKETSKRKPYQSMQFTDTVYCSHEKLNVFTISAPLRYFDNLTTIQLEDNQLTWLPGELWHLPRLQKLNIGRNALAELPADIGLLVGLKELYVHENQLVTLPSQIGQLVHLGVLDLTNNTAISFLPGEITCLSPSLRRLWIEGTSLLASRTDTNSTWLSQQRKVPSLFNLCAQQAGSSFDSISSKNTGLPLSLLYLLMSEIDPLNDTVTATSQTGGNRMDLGRTSSLVRRCSMCQSILYYRGIPLLEPHGQFGGQSLPLLYHVCSQTCKNRWLHGTK